MVDRKGILNRQRTDLEQSEPVKWEYCLKTNDEQRSGGIAEAMEGVDVCIAASRPGPGIIKKEWVGRMADDSIIFPIANPVPEIWPWEAKEAGARIVATGRSDFHNQVNNSLGFPGIFRGTLDVRAKDITDGMCIAAATALAKSAEEKGLSDDFIIPAMEDTQVFVDEAVAIGLKAMDEGVARIKRAKSELEELARGLIERSHNQTSMLMRQGFVPPQPKE